MVFAINIRADDSCLEYYKLNAWQPHCTLGYQIAEENRELAMDLMAQEMEPFNVVFEVIDWVEYPPVKILGEIPL